MDDNKPINYNRKNIKSIDEMLSDDGKIVTFYKVLTPWFRQVPIIPLR